jgi:hypothetical protein
MGTNGVNPARSHFSPFQHHRNFQYSHMGYRPLTLPVDKRRRDFFPVTAKRTRGPLLVRKRQPRKSQVKQLENLT